MIGPSSTLVQIGREIGNDTGALRSSVRWERVSSLNDADLQVLLTLLRNTYSAIVGQASVRGIKPAQQLPPEAIEKKEETNG